MRRAIGSRALDDRLSKLLDDALAALSSDRRTLDLKLRSDGDGSVVLVGGSPMRVGRGRKGILGWERLIDALPRVVERARLDAMHRAAGAEWPADWSVYSTETTRAWLAEAVRLDPSAGHERSIRAAAANDDDVTVRADGPAGPMVLKGHLRSRRLIANIKVSRNVAYASTTRTLTARDILPDTTAVAMAGRHIADIVDVPWTRDADIAIGEARVGVAGTALALIEGLAPLVSIPDAAVGAAPANGPPHAPWIVTDSERAALDAVDAEAHRQA